MASDGGPVAGTGTSTSTPTTTGPVAEPWSRRLLLPVAALGLIGGLVAALAGWDGGAAVAWATATAVVLASEVGLTVARLRRGRLTVDLVAVLALAGALALDELLAGSVIALMVASGDALERYAHRRARRDLAALVSLAPTVAHRLTADGLETVPVDTVAPGDVLVVRPGEVVPVDALVAGGTGVLDESVLTGEPLPVERAAGEAVRSGSVNAGSALRVRATAGAADSAYAGIVRLVSEAGVGRARFVRLADRYALVFIPVTLVVAGVAWLASGDAVRALAVLVVATPCPLVLAAPVAIVSGIARAARSGVVVKDGAALEALAGARTVLVDKTGTLTAGRPRVVAVIAAPGCDPAEVLRRAAAVEQGSPHVFAAAVVAEAESRGLALVPPEHVEEVPGAGARGLVEGGEVAVGSAAHVLAGGAPPWAQAAARRARREACSVVYVALDGAPAGAVLLADEVRTDTPRALRALRRAGVDRVVMLSGDRIEVAGPIGLALGVDRVYADRTPAEKVAVVRAESAGPGTAVMVGDGVNDAPALAAADLGVALGARGATASSAVAEVVLVVDRLDGLARGVAVAQRSRAIARQSVVLGMGLSFAGMGFAAVGLLAPVAGALAQELIDVTAIANALRALRRPRRERATGPVPAAWERHLRSDHVALRPVLEDLRATADGLGAASPAEGRDSLRHVSWRVLDEVVSHERVDESQIYPGVAARLPGDDPLASMSRTHQEIFHLASLLDRLASDCDDGLADADRSEARRTLYALDAVLRLHFAQEEELMASLSGGAGPP